MQFKTTVKCHNTPIKIAHILKVNTAKYWFRCRTTGTIIHLTHDSAFPLLGNSREMKMYVHTRTCTEMFVATLLLSFKN